MNKPIDKQFVLGFSKRLLLTSTLGKWGEQENFVGVAMIVFEVQNNKFVS